MNLLKIILALIFSPLLLNAQDTLSTSDLEPYTYRFAINEQGEWSGKGADYIKAELKKHPIVLLGEYHGSSRISELAAALISEMNDLGCKDFIAEVGPIAGRYINERLQGPKASWKKINEFTKEQLHEDTPFPFFDETADKLFVDKLIKNKWTTWGIDQDYIDGYKLLITRAFNNISSSEKVGVASKYQEVLDSLDHFYEVDKQDGKRYPVYVYESKIIPQFFDLVNPFHKENPEIQKALVATNNIYHSNVSRKYLKCNSDRISYMKSNLAQHLKTMDYNFDKDRLFVKMGAIHTARGFSGLSLYEVGNLLSELAEFHQQKTLHIYPQCRYEYDEEGKIADYTKAKKPWESAGKEIGQMGRMHEWTVVDLRPLHYNYFYARKFVENFGLDQLMEGYDLIVIPPIE